MKNAQPRLNNPFLYNIHQHPTETAVSHSWPVSFGFCEENYCPPLATAQEYCWAWWPGGHSPASMTQVVVSQEVPLPPNYKLLWQLPQPIVRAFEKHKKQKATEMQQKQKKKKNPNTTPETVQNAASAFIYHSIPNIVLAMSRSPRKCWAWLGKLWVRNAFHALRQPRRVQSSGMDWSYSRALLKHREV